MVFYFLKDLQMLNKELVLFLIVLVSSIAFGLDGITMKASGVDDGLLIAALRGFGATLFISTFLRRIPKFRYGKLFLGAILGSFVGTICFPLAIVDIPVGAALILFHAAILWIIVVKRVLGRPISRLDAVTGVLIFFGLTILLYQPLELTFWGAAVGLISGMGFAAFLFLGEEVSQKVPGDKFVLLDAFLFAQIGIATFGLCGSGIITEVELDPASTGQQIILLDGIMYGIAYIILAKAIERGSSHLVSAYLGGLEPFLGILFAWIFLSEGIRWQMAFGFLFVAGAIIRRGLILYTVEKRREVS